jgi:hypothetical protein
VPSHKVTGNCCSRHQRQKTGGAIVGTGKPAGMAHKGSRPPKANMMFELHYRLKPNGVWAAKKKLLLVSLD